MRDQCLAHQKSRRHLPKPRSLPASDDRSGSASSYSLRTFVTGHGQGNTNDCAEFCQATHTITVGATPLPQTPWRTCCTPQPSCEDVPFPPAAGHPPPTPGPGVASGQLGSYWYSRAGWCPGSAVEPWEHDITQAMGSGTTQSFSYGLDSYVNACRMDAPTCNPNQCPTPGGTSDANGCVFDGGPHTEPFFYTSSVVIAYR